MEYEINVLKHIIVNMRNKFEITKKYTFKTTAKVFSIKFIKSTSNSAKNIRNSLI